MRSSCGTHFLRSSFSTSVLRIPSERARISPRHRVDLRCWFTNHSLIYNSREPQHSRLEHRSAFQIEAKKSAKDVNVDATGTGNSSAESGESLSGSQAPPATIRVSEEMGQLEPKGPDSDVRDGVHMRKSVWSKLGQRINVAGIQFTSRIVWSDQHLAIPHISVPDIRWIDWKALHERGFQGVVFDKDNTLTAPYALAVWPALATSLQDCQSVFEGRVALLSNSAEQGCINSIRME